MSERSDRERQRGGERALAPKTSPREPMPGPEPGWRERCEARAAGGMVAAPHHLATDAGVEMLADGGNAFDAAVAAAFALGVCEPAASGLGGQTMMMATLGRRRRRLALDGSSRAPHRLVPGSLAHEDLLHGHRATTVPSTPATLEHARRAYGKLPLARVLEPSIRLAREGFAVSPLLHSLMKTKHAELSRRSAGAIFLDDGAVPDPGFVLRQPALADTFERLASAGMDDFYRGDIAAAIVRDMEEHAGLLHADDLAQIPWPRERRPQVARFGDRRLYTVGPPGAGRALVFLMQILDGYTGRPLDLDTPHGAHLFLLADRQAQQDRRDRPYDPDLYPQVPREKLLDRRHARRTASRLEEELEEALARGREVPGQVGESLDAGADALAASLADHGETTHLSVMDREGNVVGLTQSIERVFGSCEASPELGFLYNNYLSTFESVDISHPHYLRPGASPWASVAPTIAYRDREPELVIGSPGSERIVSAIAQVLLRERDHELLDAVAAPRLHAALDDSVSLERERVPAEVADHLVRHGWPLYDRGPWSFFLGCVQLVARRDGGFVGVADPRRDGAAKGLDA